MNGGWSESERGRAIGATSQSPRVGMRGVYRLLVATETYLVDALEGHDAKQMQ